MECTSLVEIIDKATFKTEVSHENSLDIINFRKGVGILEV
jgi:hypothetical protein